MKTWLFAIGFIILTSGLFFGGYSLKLMFDAKQEYRLDLKYSRSSFESLRMESEISTYKYIGIAYLSSGIIMSFIFFGLGSILERLIKVEAFFNSKTNQLPSSLEKDDSEKEEQEEWYSKYGRRKRY